MAHSTRGTLCAWLFLDIIESLARLGVQAAPVLAAAGLTRTRLRNPFARVDAAVEHEFWAELERVTGDPAIGLKVDVDVALRGRRGVDAYIAFNSATLRDTLRNTERFAKLSDDRGHVQVIESAASATVRIYRDGGYPRASGYIEALFAAAAVMFEQRVSGFRLQEVRLPRPQLFEGMQRGQVGLTSIARSSGMSTRTLRRRLAELGTTFQEQLDELRHSLAVEGLRSGQESIAQIAERLSYASAKAFQSAFRRWTGVAPSVYRRRQRGAGDALLHVSEER